MAHWPSQHRAVGHSQKWPTPWMHNRRGARPPCWSEGSSWRSRVLGCALKNSWFHGRGGHRSEEEADILPGFCTSRTKTRTGGRAKFLSNIKLSACGNAVQSLQKEERYMMLLWTAEEFGIFLMNTVGNYRRFQKGSILPCSFVFVLERTLWPQNDTPDCMEFMCLLENRRGIDTTSSLRSWEKVSQGNEQHIEWNFGRSDATERVRGKVYKDMRTVTQEPFHGSKVLFFRVGPRGVVSGEHLVFHHFWTTPTMSLQRPGVWLRLFQNPREQETFEFGKQASFFFFLFLYCLLTVYVF